MALNIHHPPDRLPHAVGASGDARSHRDHLAALTGRDQIFGSTSPRPALDIAPFAPLIPQNSAHEARLTAVIGDPSSIQI
jgi:hypothetical protein